MGFDFKFLLNFHVSAPYVTVLLTIELYICRNCLRLSRPALCIKLLSGLDGRGLWFHRPRPSSPDSSFMYIFVICFFLVICLFHSPPFSIAVIALSLLILFLIGPITFLSVLFIDFYPQILKLYTYSNATFLIFQYLRFLLHNPCIM